MENFMELEKRPARLKPSQDNTGSEHSSAKMAPPALQLKVTQFESAPEEEELLQGKMVSQFQMPEEEEMMQTKMDTGSGSSLPSSIQASASQQLQGDLSGVNIHQNSQKASELGALAYTQGKDIHFAPNAYDPHTSSGKSLIGHELTHVVQQSEGRVQATGEIEGMPLNDDTSLEREADEMGNRIAGA